MIVRRQIDLELRDYTIIGDKVDKKSHSGVFLNIGHSAENKKVILQKNLTSKKTITFDEECKIESTTKYKYIKNYKTVGESYETPPVIYESTLKDLKKISDRIFNDDDIRYIIKNKIYPETGMNDLTIKTQNDSIFIDKTDSTVETIKVKKNLVILQEIIKHEKAKDTLIINPICKLDAWINTAKEKFTPEELEWVETLYIANTLDPEKTAIITETKKGIKNIQIINIESINKKSELYNKIYKNQEWTLNKLEQIIDKFN